MDKRASESYATSSEVVELRQQLEAAYQQLAIFRAMESEWQLAVRSLKESQEKYQQLANYAPVGLCEIDYHRTKIVTVNDVLCEMLDNAREDLVDLDPMLLLAEESRASFADCLRQLSRGAKVQDSIECKLSGKHGELWVHADIRFVGHQEQLSRAMVVFHDINARKITEEALHQSEERFRALFNSSLILIYVHDFYGNFMDANDRALELLGYRHEEMLRLSFQDLVEESELPRLMSITREILLQGADSGPHDVKVRGKNGQTFWLEVTGTRLEKEGEPYAILGVGRDLTERKRTEEERKLLEEQLRQAQKMEALGKLAGGVAHDMNNILTAITAIASILQREDLSDRTQKDIAGILQACQKGQELTRNLLGLARKGQLKQQCLDLNKVVQEVIAILTRTIAKQVEVELTLDEQLAEIDGDANQLNHALLNLALNAVQAIPSSGVLRFITQNVPAESMAALSRFHLAAVPHVRLDVIDTGQGMDTATLEHCLEPFFTTKPKGEGTGLGLSLVYNTIKGHNGALLLDSAPGRGTQVTIYLPARRAQVTQETKSEGEAAIIAGDSETILLVDDESLIRTAARRILENLGYKVLVADGGLEALEIYRLAQASIQLIILDVIMPDLDGIETFHRLRALNPEVRVLFSSGYALEHTGEELIALGAAGFMPKPYTLSNLSHDVARALGR